MGLTRWVGMGEGALCSYGPHHQSHQTPQTAHNQHPGQDPRKICSLDVMTAMALTVVPGVRIPRAEGVSILLVKLAMGLPEHVPGDGKQGT